MLIKGDNYGHYKIIHILHHPLTLFQVQSYLPLNIVNYGVSNHYAGFRVGDRCPLGYLLDKLNIENVTFRIHVFVLSKLTRQRKWSFTRKLDVRK